MGVPRRLRAQLGVPAFFKRLIILHASKLVALLAFAAAMQAPGGLGLLLAGELCPHVFSPKDALDSPALLMTFGAKHRLPTDLVCP